MGTLPYEAPHLRGEYILVVKFCGDTDHIIAGSATCHDAQVRDWLLWPGYYGLVTMAHWNQITNMLSNFAWGTI